MDLQRPSCGCNSFSFPSLVLKESCAFLVNSCFILGDIRMSSLEIFFLGNSSTGMSGA